MTALKQTAQDREQTRTVICSIVKTYAKLARHMGTQMANVPPVLPDAGPDDLMEKFRTQWLPAIMQHAAKGSLGVDIVTDIPATEPVREKLQEFFAGTGFTVGRHRTHLLHPKFGVHQFTLFWGNA
jgi:hypothetical protein